MLGFTVGWRCAGRGARPVGLPGQGPRETLLFPQSPANPAVDFLQTPPGMLALDNMLYLARHHQDAYIRVRGLAAPHEGPCAGSHLAPPHRGPLSLPHRLSWRTAARRTSTPAPLGAAPSSSPGCSARSCRSENFVSGVWWGTQGSPLPPVEEPLGAAPLLL